MLKALINKQFSEIFRTYFVDKKTGEAKPKKKIITSFVVFALIMLLLAGMFFAMSFLFLPLMKLDRSIHWIYFAAMGAVSILLGIFGSVFNTFASLYLPKDNELLLAMPISPLKLLLSRISVVAGLAALYSGLVFVPSCIFYYIFGKPTFLSVIYDVLLFLLITLFVSALTCILGFFVALIALSIKNKKGKSFITVFLSILFIGCYYFAINKMNTAITYLATHPTTVGNSIKKWGNLIYQLGKAAMGKSLSMLIFAGVTVVLCGICIFVLSKTFLNLATKNKGEKNTQDKSAKISKQSGVMSALVKKEFLRFTGSATYMLNCGLGIIFTPAVAVFCFIKRKTILSALPTLSSVFGIDVNAYLPLVTVAVIALISSMNTVSTPSVSLEGKNLWILKSLPVQTKDIINAKLKLHNYLCVPSVVLSVVIMGIALKLDVTFIILGAALLTVITYFIGAIGLMFGIKNPNFNWTNETTPTKQSLNVLFVLLIGWVIPVVIVGGFYLIRRFLVPDFEAATFLSALVVIFAFAVRFVTKWLVIEGAKTLEEL